MITPSYRDRTTLRCASFGRLTAVGQIKRALTVRKLYPGVGYKLEGATIHRNFTRVGTSVGQLVVSVYIEEISAVLAARFRSAKVKTRSFAVDTEAYKSNATQYPEPAVKRRGAYSHQLFLAGFSTGAVLSLAAGFPGSSAGAGALTELRTAGSSAAKKPDTSPITQKETIPQNHVRFFRKESRRLSLGAT